MNADWYESYIDLERYPVTSPDSPRGLAWLTECRETLKRLGSVEIPDFVTPVGVERMAAESATLESLAHHNELVGNAYLDELDPSLPADHARRLTDRTALGAISYDMVPETHLLRKVYEWDALMSFLGTVLGLDKIYRYGDPLGALNIAVMKERDYLRWHFDQTDFVTSLSIQSADTGGEFEYVPMIRSEDKEQYDRVKAVIQGSREGVCTIANRPGTLVLFQGRYSLHRVTEIRGSTSRLMGLFGYDSKPGTMSSEYLRKIRYGQS